MIPFRTLPILFIFFVGSLYSQTFQFGVNGNYLASQFFTPTMSYSASDSSYILSGGYGFGLSAAVFFDHGGYYHRKIYGIRLEGIYSRQNQSYRIFPGQGTIDPDIFYRYRLKTSYVDLPVLFAFCPTHHQGMTVEAGPQISFLNKVSTVIEEERNTQAVVPTVSKDFFRPVTFSVIGGVGIFYSFTESFALTGTIRATYSISDITRPSINRTSVSPDHKLTLGVFAQAIYKINKYDAKKNRGYKYYMKRIHK